MKKIYLLSLLLTSLLGEVQSLERYVIALLGSYFETGNILLSSTIS